MPAFKLYVDQDSGDQYLTVFQNDGSLLAATGDHPRFEEIRELLVNGNPNDVNLEDLFSPGKGITTEFAKISTELSIRGDRLFYEGEELSGVLADKIIDLYEAQEDYAPFVLFLEKLKTNPVQDSIDNLYRFLAAGDFVIADDGDFIAYKGLNYEFRSIHSGPVIRNGVEFDGHVLNVPGDVIEMDRGDVTWNPNVACGKGLHAGTWDYASGFGRNVVKVKINPKYVVSVPRDSSDQKVRVCRYTVVEQVTDRLSGNYDRGYIEVDNDFSEDPADDFVELGKDDIDPAEIQFNLVRAEAVPDSEQEVNVTTAEVADGDAKGWPLPLSEEEVVEVKPKKEKKGFWGKLGL